MCIFGGAYFDLTPAGVCVYVRVAGVMCVYVFGVLCLQVLFVIYTDDIVLLAPCASALRTMLSICNKYALSHGLKFKTQLICFRSQSTRPCSATISLNFNGTVLCSRYMVEIIILFS